MSDDLNKRDKNNIPTISGVTDDSDQFITIFRFDPTTKRLKVDALISTIGDVDINDISKGTQTNDIKITLDGEAVNPTKIVNVNSQVGSVGTTATQLTIPANTIAIKIINTHASNILYVGDAGILLDGSAGGSRLDDTYGRTFILNGVSEDIVLYTVGSAASTTFIVEYYLSV